MSAGVIYDLRHRTTYTYEAPVTFARCVLRLTPRSSASQTVLRSIVSVTPTPASTLERTGPYGEQTLTVVIDKPHRTLVIEARSRVDVHAPPLRADAHSPAWEQVRDEAFATDTLSAEGPAAFLYPTRRTPIIAGITEYARRSFPPGRPDRKSVV